MSLNGICVTPCRIERKYYQLNYLFLISITSLRLHNWKLYSQLKVSETIYEQFKENVIVKLT